MCTRRSVLAIGLAAAAALALAVRLGATTVVALGDDELVALSRVIVHGDVVGKESRLAAEGGRIYTEYRFRVRELMKGEAGSDQTIAFREWGGRVGNVHYWLPGVGEFALGEEVVAFLGEPDARTGIGFTTGLAQGKFRVLRPADGTPRVRRELGVLRLIDRGGTEVQAEQADERDLEAFKTSIRRRIGR